MNGPRVECVSEQRARLAIEDRPTRAEVEEVERARPRIRGDCIVCPTCQAERDRVVPDDADDLPPVSLACGHTGLRVTCHSRPCAFYSCRYHLGLEVTRKHEIQVAIDPEDLTEKTPTCALDLADDAAFPLEAVGDMIGVTRERVRQIEEKALAHAYVNGAHTLGR